MPANRRNFTYPPSSAAASRRGPACLLACATLAASLLLPSPTLADVTWTGPSGNWSDPGNWSPTPPDPINNAFITHSDLLNRTITLDRTITLNSLYLSNTGGGSSTLDQTGTFDLTFSNEYLGYGANSVGAHSQSSGQNIFNDLYLGCDAGSTGYYNLSGTGTLYASITVGMSGAGIFNQTDQSFVSSNTISIGTVVRPVSINNLRRTASISPNWDMYVGEAGSATFNQTGGTNFAGDLWIGMNGVYNLSDSGSLTGFSEYIGEHGTFNQSGGTHVVAGTLNVDGTAEGQYNLSGSGSLTVTNFERIGRYGLGSFRQTGGTHTVSQNLEIATNYQDRAGTAAYQLSGTGSLVVNGYEDIGNCGTATFSQSGGSNTISEGLRLGGGLLTPNLPPGRGTYLLSMGSLVAGGESIGAVLGFGFFDQSGGVNTTRGMSVGFFAGTGVYNLSGGCLVLTNTSGTSEGIGDEGRGTFNQSGGTHTIAQRLIIGGNGGDGIYNLSGSGTLIVGTIANNAVEFIGQNYGHGTFSQTGGSHVVYGTLILRDQPSASGFYSLTGGTLSATNITINSGGNFTQTGGLVAFSALNQTAGSVTFGGTQSLYTIASITISGGTTALNVDSKKLLVVNNLALTNSGRLDLSANDLLYHSTAGSLNATFATLKNYLAGQTLYSSASSSITALALMKSSDYLSLYGANATFDNQPLTSYELLVKYTYTGDADFDGRITLSDYSLLEAGFLFGNYNGNAGDNPAPWVHGDFNNDGYVNYQDYALIDNAFLSQSGTLAPDQITAHALQFGSLYTQDLANLRTSVPEPASLYLLALATTILLRHRRHAQSER